MAVGPDLDILGDRRRLHHAGPYDAASTDRGLDDLCPRTDDGLGTDDGRSREDGPRLDPGVLPDLHRRVDERAGWVDDGHPRPHVALRDLAPHDQLRGGELQPVIDPHRQLRTGRADDHRLPTRRGRDRHQIGEVVLARRRGRNCTDVGAQPSAVEAVGACVHLAERSGLRIGIALLDDRTHGAVGGADDAAVAGWVGRPRGKQGEAGVARGLGLQELGKERCRDERRIRHRHHDLVRVGGDLLEAGTNGIGGPLLRLLAHRSRPPREQRLDLFRSMPDHDNWLLDPGRGERGQHVLEHRASGERVENLRQARAHAGSLSGGKDDRRRARHDRSGSSSGASATISISTRAPLGSAFTAIVDRAGKGGERCVA